MEENYKIAFSYTNLNKASKMAAKVCYDFLKTQLNIHTRFIYYSGDGNSRNSQASKSKNEFLDIFTKSEIDLIFYSNEYSLDAADFCINEFKRIEKKLIQQQKDIDEGKLINKKYHTFLFKCDDRDPFADFPAWKILNIGIETLDYSNVLKTKIKPLIKNKYQSLINNNTSKFPDIEVVFKLLEKEKYQELLKIVADQLNGEIDLFGRESISEELVRKLKVKNLIIINGPIHSGKSTLAKSIVERFENAEKIEIESSKWSKSEALVKSKQELLFIWFNKIFLQNNIRSKYVEPYLSNSKTISENRIISHLLGTILNDKNQETFNDILESYNLGLCDSIIYKFIHLVSSVANDIGYTGKVILFCTFDNISDYLEGGVFGDLTEDLNIIIPPERVDNFYLIITTRDWMSNHPIDFIYNINRLSKEKQKTHFDFILKEEDALINVECYDILYSMTEGQVWILLRLLQLYLENRVNGNTDNPLKLISNIVKDPFLFFNNRGIIIDRTDYIKTALFLIKTKTKLEEFIKELENIVMREKEGDDINTLDFNYKEKHEKEIFIQLGLIQSKGSGTLFLEPTISDILFEYLKNMHYG